MRVIIAPDAVAQIAHRKKWWLKNRDKAPRLFDQEFADAIAQIGRAPESFPVFSEKHGRTVRRCLMPKTRCHLYIEIDAAVDGVWVLAAGGGQRRRPPRIKKRP